jgi:hypothetical protein
MLLFLNIRKTSTPIRTAFLLFTVTVISLVLFPFVLSIYLNAGFLSLSNEPLAYRFFYSDRIFQGESIAVEVGYAVSLIHHLSYLLINNISYLSGSSLEVKLNNFNQLNILIISAIICIFFVLAATSKKLLIIDVISLSLIILMPIYGANIMGFDGNPPIFNLS